MSHWHISMSQDSYQWAKTHEKCVMYVTCINERHFSCVWHVSMKDTHHWAKTHEKCVIYVICINERHFSCMWHVSMKDSYQWAKTLFMCVTCINERHISMGRDTWEVSCMWWMKDSFHVCDMYQWRTQINEPRHGAFTCVYESWLTHVWRLYGSTVLHLLPHYITTLLDDVYVTWLRLNYWIAFILLDCVFITLTHYSLIYTVTPLHLYVITLTHYSNCTDTLLTYTITLIYTLLTPLHVTWLRLYYLTASALLDCVCITTQQVEDENGSHRRFDEDQVCVCVCAYMCVCCVCVCVRVCLVCMCVCVRVCVCVCVGVCVVYVCVCLNVCVCVFVWVFLFISPRRYYEDELYLSV